jgi:hypothetical protein
MYAYAPQQKLAAIVSAMFIFTSGLPAQESTASAEATNRSFPALEAPHANSTKPALGRGGRFRKPSSAFSGIPIFAASRQEKAGSPQRKPAAMESRLSTAEDTVEMGSASQSLDAAEPESTATVPLILAHDGGPVNASEWIGQMISPRPESTLATVQTFSWSAGAGASGYWLWAGSCQDCTDLYDGSLGQRTQAAVSIPNDGRRIFVTLFTFAYGDWWWVDYQYTAPTRTAQRAQMQQPSPGATLVASQTFTWSGGTYVDQYWLWVGSCQDCTDILDESQGSRTSRILTLPTNGRVIYVTLFSLINGDWYWIDYQYRAGSDPVVTATLVVTNQLIYAVNLLVNGVVVGSVPAGETRQTDAKGTSIALSWELVRPTVSGRAVGDVMGGRFNTIDRPSGRYSFTIDNRVGDTVYFVPMISNRTPVPLLIEVNGGLQAENRCNCTAAANTDNVAAGYYRLFSNSNLRLYGAGSNYTGRYIYWADFATRLEAGTGRYRVTATSAP